MSCIFHNPTTHFMLNIRLENAYLDAKNIILDNFTVDLSEKLVVRF